MRSLATSALPTNCSRNCLISVEVRSDPLKNRSITLRICSRAALRRMAVAAAPIWLAREWHRSGSSLRVSRFRVPPVIMASNSRCANDMIGRLDGLARDINRVVRICAWRSSTFGREPLPADRELMAAGGMRHHGSDMAPGVDIALAHRSAVEPDVGDEGLCRRFPVENSGQSRSPAAARLIASRASPFSNSPGGNSTDRLASAGRSASREAHSFKRSRSIARDDEGSPLIAARPNGSIHAASNLVGCVAARA